MSSNDIIVHCKTSQQIAAASIHPFTAFFWGLTGWITGTVASAMLGHKNIDAERTEIAENWQREQSALRDSRNRYEKALDEMKHGATA